MKFLSALIGAFVILASASGCSSGSEDTAGAGADFSSPGSASKSAQAKQHNTHADAAKACDDAFASVDGAGGADAIKSAATDWSDCLVKANDAVAVLYPSGPGVTPTWTDQTASWRRNAGHLCDVLVPVDPQDSESDADNVACKASWESILAKIIDAYVNPVDKNVPIPSGSADHPKCKKSLDLFETTKHSNPNPPGDALDCVEADIGAIIDNLPDDGSGLATPFQIDMLRSATTVCTTLVRNQGLAVRNACTTDYVVLEWKMFKNPTSTP